MNLTRWTLFQILFSLCSQPIHLKNDACFSSFNSFSFSTITFFKSWSKSKEKSLLVSLSEMLSTSTRLSQGTTALVTGAAGYLGCAIVDQLLKQRYKVKATTRNKVKLEEFKSKADVEYGLGLLEIVEIPDLTIPGALDEALKGEFPLIL